MKSLLRRILNYLAYLAAGIVIALAIAVGLFRLFLPRLPEYQEDIKAWANSAIGMQVEFAGMNARWRLSGPELNFYEAELSFPDGEGQLLEAAEVTVGVGLLRLLTDRTLVVDRILVRETELTFERDENDRVIVQGIPIEDLADLIPESNEGADVVVIGQDISVRYREQAGDEGLSFEVDLIEASRDDDELTLEASLDLEEGFGSRLDIAADQRIIDDSQPPLWQLYFEGRSLGLPRWSFLLPDDVAPVISGSGDVSLWVELTRDGIEKATANFAVDEMAIAGADRTAPFDVEGRLEFSDTGAGVLIAAENLRLRTVDNDWPRSSLQVQLDARDADAGITGLNANASFLRLDDVAYLSSWLPPYALEYYDTYQPSGDVRNLSLGIDDSRTDERRFDVSATLDDVGLSAAGAWPGVRGFTGAVRVDSNGGRVEFESTTLRVDIPQYLSETLIFDDAIGTVIWRKSGDRLTVLSDRLQLRNADFDSQSSLQVTVAGAGASPVVDFESIWSVNDVASAKRYLPERVINEKLHDWLITALQSGSMTGGTARLSGPIERFPFDDGGGQFLIKTRLENAVMRYANGWPDASVRSMDIVLDGMRLYSERNVLATAANRTLDATVAIADLREPILTIDAFATGTLESIRDYARRSPIADVFGGQLDRVRVGGDASLSLNLIYPIKDRASYEFVTRMQVSDGSMNLIGFAPPVTELNGIIDISRTTVSSESLFARFLGEPVSLELTRTDDPDSAYSVIATADGRITAEGLIGELDAPLDGYVDGASDYRATIRFPKAGLETPVPVQLAVNSDLGGFGLDLPAPLNKAAADELPLALLIEFPGDGQIASNGSLGEDIRWGSQFLNENGRWDFDRGAIAFGGEYPDFPESRGLHIRGHAETIRLDSWLAVARGRSGSNGGSGLGERIRSIDLAIDNLYLFGQHVVDHRVSVDRSGNEWFARSEGAQIAGTVTIPYDLDGDQPIVLEMQTLILPGDDSDSDDDEATLDPRELPAISIKADEFALGDRFLGTVTADFRSTTDGLRASGISAKDESFWVEGTAGWVADARLPSGQQSYLSAQLVSNNVKKTMERLNYNPGIDSDDMEIDLDVRWPGGPRQDFMDELSGEVAVRFGIGQLNEVEPGAGRMFGLMSIVALPRRLSLDFRDVLDKGFGFDEISGTFTLDNGNAHTCDLSLKGPAADIGIVGQASLATGEYNQTALVSANVGNTLPVVGAVVAGPQVAAALLIFSQIFKKPLQEMGQVYYGIDGTFDEPLVEVADAERFALTSELAGCLVESN